LARAVPSVAFRVPAHAGAMSVYALPHLETTPWGAGSRMTGARGAVGADLIGRRLLYRDTAGAVTSFDLVVLRERPIAPRTAQASIGADGTLLTVDSTGTVLESQPWGTRTWPGSLGRGVREIFAAPGSRLAIVRRHRGDSLQFVTRESGMSAGTLVPEAIDRAATRDGDAFAFLTDSGIVVFEDRELPDPWFVRLAAHPRAVVFSPSGHRLYVALRDKNALAVVDRFNRRERGSISLPGRATALRMDPWGRVLLVRGAGDGGEGETWVVGIASGDMAGRLRTGWASDLPTVSEDGILLSRESGAVVARDVRSLDSLGAVAGGTTDVWFTGRWVPTSAVLAARQKADSARGKQLVGARIGPVTAPPAGAAAAPAAAPGLFPAPAPAPEVSFWVQVASLRNGDAAHALAAELRAEHQPAVVLEPRQEGDPWRVMTGPYPTHEAADSAGRSLNRPYWVVDRSREPAKP
jgi:cell division septation protein DedD